MVPVVVRVVVLAVGILHLCQTPGVLYILVAEIVTSQFAFVGYHAGVDVCLVAQLRVAFKELAEVFLTEVAGMVKHDVEDNLDTLGVCFVNEFLEHHVAALCAVTALVAAVHLGKIHGVVAVIVVT